MKFEKDIPTLYTELPTPFEVREGIAPADLRDPINPISTTHHSK